MTKLRDTSANGAVFFAVCRGKVRFYSDIHMHMCVCICMHTHMILYIADDHLTLVYFIIDQVSEGLDFADKAGRAVIVTGIPFALWNDPKVVFCWLFMLSDFVH